MFPDWKGKASRKVENIGEIYAMTNGGTFQGRNTSCTEAGEEIVSKFFMVWR